MLPVNKENVLKWFKGKSREKAEHALFLLSESEAEGQWVPKASRSVRAALGKHNIASKFGRDAEAILSSIKSPKSEHADYALGDGYYLASTMIHGSIARLLHIDLPRLTKLAKTDEQKSTLKVAVDYFNTFEPLAKLMRQLDETRPKPVFTQIGVSRTITKTLEDASLDLNISTIRVCPHEYFRVLVWREDKKGNKFQRWETHMRLLWPKNTVFNASRFASRFTHCHSCGHAIHNPFNWCPILIDNKAGVPHALWVGRDCAQTVFGIKVTGEVEIEGGKK